jgi:hypothetical protein
MPLLSDVREPTAGGIAERVKLTARFNQPLNHSPRGARSFKDRPAREAHCAKMWRPTSLTLLTPVSAMLTSSSLRRMSIALATPASPPAPSPNI